MRRFWTALKSGHPAAYWGMALQIFGPLVRSTDSLVVRSKGSSEGDARIVFIVGNSRSGTTLAFQVLTRFLPSVFPTNYHILSPHRAAAQQVKFPARRKITETYSSFYGYNAGLTGVNEGNQLVQSIHRAADDPVKLGKALKKLVVLFGGSSKQPLIIKNIGIGTVLDKILEADSGAIVVRMIREEQPLVRSVGRAYRELGSFNPRIPGWEPEIQSGEIETVAKSYTRELEKHFDRCVENLPAGQVLRISYESFCEQPQRYVNQLADLLGVKPHLLDELRSLSFKASK